MWQRWLVVILGGLGTLAAGCSYLTPIRDGGVGTAPGIGTTAEYRIITERVRFEPKLENGKITYPAEHRVICTEPSPDIAKAFSSALSVKVSQGTASGSLGYQSAEALAQLGKRYATVQLLRDMLYRDCEDYSNGAIDEVEYAFRLSRFGATIVTLLGIEMVSGDTATSPPPVSSPPLTLMSTGSGPVTVNPSPPTQAPAQTQADDGGKTDDSLPSKIIAAIGKIGAAETSDKPADDAVSKLPTPASDPEKAAVTLLKKANDSIKSALNAVKKAWDQILKAGGKPDATATDLVGAANTVIATATDDTNKSHQAAIGLKDPINDADTKILKASGDLTAAGKAVVDVNTALTAKPAAPKQASTNPRALSDQQALSIEHMQREYLRDATMVPIAVVCASVMNRLRYVDVKEGETNNTVLGGRSGLSGLCASIDWAGTGTAGPDKTFTGSIFLKMLNFPR
jgi:hypothetical protein